MQNVGRNQKMQAIQCKHPSESEYQTVKLFDPVDVKGEQYAVAVDICDGRNKDIFMSFLSVLSRKDKVTLITFGRTAEMIDFDMKQFEDNKALITDALAREKSGLNTLVGVRYLERVQSNKYIMITAGLHDSAPQNLESKVNIKLFSPGTDLSENYCKMQTFVSRWDVTFFPKNGPHECLIRSALNIKPAQYYDISISGREMSECPALPYGGYRKVFLPYKTECRLMVSFMTFNGTVRDFECEPQDDDTCSFRSNIMKPCAMVE